MKTFTATISHDSAKRLVDIAEGNRFTYKKAFEFCLYFCYSFLPEDKAILIGKSSINAATKCQSIYNDKTHERIIKRREGFVSSRDFSSSVIDSTYKAMIEDTDEFRLKYRNFNRVDIQ